MATEVRIRPSRHLFEVGIADLWQYRDLFLLLVRRDLVVRYKQTVFGRAWVVIQPVLTTLVFTAVFSRVAGIPTDGAPPVLFYLAGLLAWNYFAQTFGLTATTFIGNAYVFSKVYFSRMIIPLSVAFANLVPLLIQVVTFSAFYAYYKMASPHSATFGVTRTVLIVPLLIVQLVGLSLGAGLLMSAVTAKYRDFAHVSGLLIQLCMYATPIIYPLSRVPGELQWAAKLNPMTFVVEAFRAGLLGTGYVTLRMALPSVLSSIALFVIGWLVFNQVQMNAIDTA